MDIRKSMNWQEHKMLPHYAKAYEKDLKMSIKQLKKLKETQSRPYMLNEGIIEQIEDFHKSQNAYNHVFLNQFKKWHSKQTDNEIIELITQIEKRANQLEHVNHKILALIDVFKYGAFSGCHGRPKAGAFGLR